MEDYIKEELERWLKDIEEKISNLDQKTINADRELELLRIKHRIVNQAKEGIGHRKERQQKFYDIFISDIQDKYDKAADEHAQKLSDFRQTKSDLYLIKSKIEEYIKMNY